MVTISVRVEELRRAWMPGRRMTGLVDVSAVGLRLLGRPIASLEFERFGYVRYRDASGSVLNVFQDVASLDD